MNTSSNSSTTTMYPLAPLDPTYRRRGFSFTVQHRPEAKGVVDVADYDLPADQRGAITDQADVAILNTGADVVLRGDGPVLAWDGTTLDDPLSDDDKALLVRVGLATWRLGGMICRTPGPDRVFTVEHNALRGYLTDERHVTEDRVNSMDWSEIIEVIHGCQRAQEGPQQAAGAVDGDDGGQQATGNVQDTKWPQVRDEAEAYVKTHGFPEKIKTLVDVIGCDPKTLRKAIRNSPMLTAAKETRARRESPRTVGLTDTLAATIAAPEQYDVTNDPQFDELMAEPDDELIGELVELGRYEQPDHFDEAEFIAAARGMDKVTLVSTFLVYKKTAASRKKKSLKCAAGRPWDVPRITYSEGSRLLGATKETHCRGFAECSSLFDVLFLPHVCRSYSASRSR